MRSGAVPSRTSKPMVMPHRTPVPSSCKTRAPIENAPYNFLIQLRLSGNNLRPNGASRRVCSASCHKVQHTLVDTATGLQRIQRALYDRANSGNGRPGFAANSHMVPDAKQCKPGSSMPGIMPNVASCAKGSGLWSPRFCRHHSIFN